MKMRITNNSIRFRLRRSEVQTFYNNNKIDEVLAFGPMKEMQLHFVLETVNDKNIMASFKSNVITVQLPLDITEQWANSEQVGIEAVAISNGYTISILVEKDFACLDKPAEENEDTFPNPKALC